MMILILLSLEGWQGYQHQHSGKELNTQISHMTDKSGSDSTAPLRKSEAVSKFPLLHTQMKILVHVTFLY